MSQFTLFSDRMVSNLLENIKNSKESLIKILSWEEFKEPKKNFSDEQFGLIHNELSRCVVKEYDNLSETDKLILFTSEIIIINPSTFDLFMSEFRYQKGLEKSPEVLISDEYLFVLRVFFKSVEKGTYEVFYQHIFERFCEFLLNANNRLTFEFLGSFITFIREGKISSENQKKVKQSFLYLVEMCNKEFDNRNTKNDEELWGLCQKSGWYPSVMTKYIENKIHFDNLKKSDISQVLDSITTFIEQNPDFTFHSNGNLENHLMIIMKSLSLSIDSMHGEAKDMFDILSELKEKSISLAKKFWHVKNMYWQHHTHESGPSEIDIFYFCRGYLFCKDDSDKKRKDIEKFLGKENENPQFLIELFEIAGYGFDEPLKKWAAKDEVDFQKLFEVSQMLNEKQYELREMLMDIGIRKESWENKTPEYKKTKAINSRSPKLYESYLNSFSNYDCPIDIWIAIQISNHNNKLPF
ncbi:MAG: hypothetical protein NT068_01670 [Candidatus Nomurabacteria bacterium]|nr:hypothetical protein [Candidatus Nomurabacteria bacterium]